MSDVPARVPRGGAPAESTAVGFAAFVPVLVVMVAAIVPALPTIGGTFVVDDFHFILDNAAVTGGQLGDAWRPVQTAGGWFYRPIAFSLHALECRLWGSWATGYRLVSLLFHLLVCLAVYGLGRRLLDRNAALVASMLFAVHPVHAEVIAHAANRAEALATLGTVGAALCALHPRAAVRIAGVLAASFVGAMSKESGWFAPALIGALVLLSPHAGGGDALVVRGRAAVRAAWPAAVGVLAAVAVRAVAMASAGATPRQPFFESGTPLDVLAASSLACVWRYAVVAVTPFRLVADYAPPAFGYESFAAPVAWLGLLLAVAVTVVLVRALRRPGDAAAGVGWFAVGMVPFLHLVSSPVLMAERFVYQPSVGLCLAAGAGYAALERRGVSTRRLVVGAVGVALALRLAVRVAEWRDPISLWSADIETTGGSAYAWANYGLALWHVGEREDAVRWLRRAIDLRPNIPEWQQALSSMEGQLGHGGR